MHLSILGEGALVAPLTQLSKRAGHTVDRIEEGARAAAYGRSDLLVLVGRRLALADLLAGAGGAVRDDAVIVDATTPETRAEQRAISGRGLSNDAWAASLPGRRVVRALASVPAAAFAAFAAIAAREAPGDRSDLAVPLAGDDADAKGTVRGFLRQLGVEPVDLGPSAVGYVMDAGGPLWGAAVSALELQEMVGWLSGDG